MASSEERKRRGNDIVKKYKPGAANDAYAAAVDAITDILIAVAQSEEEADQLLQSAEVDFRSCIEGEHFAAEG